MHPKFARRCRPAVPAAAQLAALDAREEAALRAELEAAVARERGGHRCFELEIAPGQFARVNGDPTMDAETRAALAEMFRLAYAQALAKLA